jgi:hypothetical protein
MRMGVAVALCILVAAVVWAGDPSSEQSWLDLENCSMCKNMAAEEGLMEHMQWDTHMVATGYMSITTVDPEYEEAYQRSHAAMMKVWERMEGGEQLPLCGYCTSMGKLHAAGAEFDEIDSRGQHIMLVSATDPETVEMIQAHAKRTLDEYAKMSAKEGDEHAGHDH